MKWTLFGLTVCATLTVLICVVLIYLEEHFTLFTDGPGDASLGFIMGAFATGLIAFLVYVSTGVLFLCVDRSNSKVWHVWAILGMLGLNLLPGCFLFLP